MDSSLNRAWQAGWAYFLLGLLVGTAPAQAQDRMAVATARADDAAPTWAADVAPIFFDKCVQCHRPDGIGPMSLLDYATARRYASMIRSKVRDRKMPPWHVDRYVGIQEYKNDASLSDEQVETIVQWVEAGALQGNASDAPPLPDLPDPTEWQLAELLGPPDFVVSSPVYNVKPNSQDQWFNPTTEFKDFIDGPRYVRATELKGADVGSVRVLHHAHASYHPAGQGDGDFRSALPLGRQGVGKGGDLFPENTGMLLQPEGTVDWGLHYYPTTYEVPAVAEAAVWLYPEGYVPEHMTTGEVQFRIDRNHDRRDTLIPPNSMRVLQGVFVLDSAMVMASVRPHMHMRGKEQSIEAVYPDGRRELLIKVNNYEHFWQISYEFAEEKQPLLPKGTMLLMTTVWDNTSANPINPDPDQWVAWGQRGVDEMSHVWVTYSKISDEEYERRLAARARLTAED